MITPTPLDLVDGRMSCPKCDEKSDLISDANATQDVWECPACRHVWRKKRDRSGATIQECESTQTSGGEPPRAEETPRCPACDDNSRCGHEWHQREDTAEITALRQQVQALQGERDAYKRDFDAELAGNAAMRARLGARPEETMFAFVDRLEAELKTRDEQIAQLRDQVKLLTHKVITCGVAARHPNANLTREKKCYAETWNSPQAESVRQLRIRADAAESTAQALREALELAEGKLKKLDEVFGWASRVVDDGEGGTMDVFLLNADEFKSALKKEWAILAASSSTRKETP